MEKHFEICDYYELLALHKIIIEAKFHENPENFYIAGSPHAAKISRRVIACLLEFEKKGNHHRSHDWEKWLKGEPGNWIWQRAFKYAQEERDWSRWNIDEKIEYVHNVFSPFNFSDDMIKAFILQVENSKKEENEP